MEHSPIKRAINAVFATMKSEDGQSEVIAVELMNFGKFVEFFGAGCPDKIKKQRLKERIDKMISGKFHIVITHNFSIEGYEKAKVDFVPSSDLLRLLLLKIGEL